MTKRRSNPAEDEVKFLLRLSKKGKGAVDLDLAERALGLIAFSIEPTRLALDLAKHTDGAYLLRDMLKPWAERHRLRFVHGPRYSDPKVWSFAFEDSQDVEGARADLKDDVVTVATQPEDVDVGQLYFTEILPGSTVGSWPGFHVKKIWLGDTGLIVTAPNGKSATIPMPVARQGVPQTGPLNIATLWTFLYKNGAAEAAKAYLDTLPQEEFEAAKRTKAERERILQARSALPEIAAVFRDITDRQYREVIKFLEAFFIDQMKRVVEWQQEGKRVEWSKIPAQGQVQRIMHQVRDPRGRYVWEPLPDYEERAHQEAVRAADEAREQFVHKNTARISEIAKRKSDIPTATILSLTGGGRGDYGGEILFRFKDGSSFVLRNKTVWKRSPLGVYFAQFPTTFHNVVLPSGKSMPQPSEARMLDVFAGGSPEQNAARRAQYGRLLNPW